MDYVSFSLEQQEGCFRGDKYEKVLEGTLMDFAELLHEREWYLSGDICEGTWNEARDIFLAKYLDIEPVTPYCKDCEYWHLAGDSYGRCEFEKGCLTHRSQSICERFSRKEKE